MSETSPTLTLSEKIAALGGVELREHEPMARHVSMGVGGPARWFAVAGDEAALSGLLALLRPCATPWLILGGGSNTLFTSAGYEGVVVSLGKAFKTMAPGPGPDQITAGGAAPLSAVVNLAKRERLSGLEFAAGIPGQLGGALAGNAGTAAGEVCPLVETVELIDAGGQRLVAARGAFAYGYRHSSLRQGVILRATLQLRGDDPEAIQARIDAALAKRGEQPLGVRTSGCMFKNPPGDTAGRLIDAAELKGERIGGARISQQHANFMINDGTASAEDIQALVERVRARVRQRHGVNLELEVRMVGLDLAP